MHAAYWSKCLELAAAAAISILVGTAGGRLTAVTATGPEELVQQAQALSAAGKINEAVGVYAQLLDNFPRTDEADRADSLLEGALRQLDDSELLKLSEESSSHRVKAKVSLLLAMRFSILNDDCNRATALCDQIAEQYPGTPEARRATLLNATNCLIVTHRDNDALHALRRLSETEKEPQHQAYALYTLGTLYEWREERKLARDTFAQIIRQYPPDLKYPNSRGIPIVEMAKNSLNLLDHYRLSPLLDRALFILSRWLGVQRKPADELNPKVMSTLQELIVLLVRLGSLLLALVLLTVVPAKNVPPDSNLFSPRWTLPTLTSFLILLWVAWFFVGVICSATWLNVISSETKLANHLRLREILMILVNALSLTVCLWREPVKNVLGFHATGKKRWLLAVLGLTLLLGPIGLIVNSLSRSLRGGVNIENRGQEALWIHGVDPVLIGLGLVGILVGVIAEEVLWRGVAYEVFRRRLGTLGASLLSSLVFALAHPVPLGTVLQLMLLGLTAMFLRVRFGSLQPAILLHVIHNLLALAK